MQDSSPAFVDEVDGSPAQVTVNFSVDGEHYEIHLSKSNRNAFVRDLARFMAAARRTGGSGPRVRYEETKADPHAVRAWARANGIPVPEGKRLPREVIDQFHAAGN